MKVRFEHAELDDPALLVVAGLLLEWGQEEGAIPRERPALTGCEEAVLAYADTPAGKDTVVGGAIFYQPEDHDLLFVDVLFVATSHRRQGIGGALLDLVSDAAIQRGLPEIRFGTLVGNRAMQALGRRCGFGEMAIFMSRRLVTGRIQ